MRLGPENRRCLIKTRRAWASADARSPAWRYRRRRADARTPAWRGLRLGVTDGAGDALILGLALADGLGAAPTVRWRSAGSGTSAVCYNTGKACAVIGRSRSRRGVACCRGTADALPFFFH